MMRATKDAGDAKAVDPLRPADHAESVGEIRQSTLDALGWIRWAWRQLTSMRTALILLLALAIAAVPGSLFPQRTADPNGVIQWRKDNPDLFPVADSLGLFTVYSSAWFSAIYLLLFVSLVGCVVPRARHHWRALRSAPPRTPARLERLDVYRAVTLAAPGSGAAAVSRTVDLAEVELRRAGYRVRRYGPDRAPSVSAERGYLRETGNLAFHCALVGVLVSVGVGSSFAYTGQRVIVEGTTYVNTVSEYSSFAPGRFVDGTRLSPYSITLDDFRVSYVLPGAAGAGQAGDFVADVTLRTPGRDDARESVIVNSPLTVGGDRIFLLGNGYAPTLTVRNAAGDVVYNESQPFLPQDNNMTSLGIVKVTDGMPEQLGLVGFLYPTQGVLESGASTSVYPDMVNPVITFNVFSGDLGIDDGTPRSVYILDTGELTQLTGGDTGEDSLELTPGSSADLPDGLGTVTWDVASPEDVAKRFVSLQIQHDPATWWVLGFSVIATVGLIAGLLVPRRRLWVKASVENGAVRVEYAGLARGEDPTLRSAVDGLSERHQAALARTKVASDDRSDREPVT